MHALFTFTCGISRKFHLLDYLRRIEFKIARWNYRLDVIFYWFVTKITVSIKLMPLNSARQNDESGTHHCNSVLCSVFLVILCPVWPLSFQMWWLMNGAQRERIGLEIRALLPQAKHNMLCKDAHSFWVKCLCQRYPLTSIRPKLIQNAKVHTEGSY